MIRYLAVPLTTWEHSDLLLLADLLGQRPEVIVSQAVAYLLDLRRDELDEFATRTVAVSMPAGPRRPSN